ncbi:MAG: YjbQ family protein [Spirochaetales bacterium]|nr:MAG: YjbQ family protein [Spirochaetales bacterium]
MKFKVENLRTRKQEEVIYITDTVADFISVSGLKEGLCVVYCPHTTAGLTINEAADPSVASDILMELGRRIPFQDGYAHGEGNSAAHIKASLMGPGVTIPVRNGALQLGTWQGIYFCEFDGPRNRSFSISLLSDIE